MKSTRWLGVLRDREILEELRSQPELLAIADAVHGALGREERDRRRRRLATRWLAMAAVVSAAVLAAVLLLPWGSGGQGFVGDALAAIPGRGPVVHTRITAVLPREMLVRTEDGRSTSVVVTCDLWYLPRENLLRTSVREGRRTIADYISTPQAMVAASRSSSLNRVLPAAIQFSTGYRQALVHRQVTEISAGVMIGGRRVRWVEFATKAGSRVEVALDEQSLVPREIRSLSARGAFGARANVARIETSTVSGSAFDAPHLR
ncbi:MAG: hypothetical protein ACRDQZ_13395, partial [Mycobacteriales bacterium]